MIVYYSFQLNSNRPGGDWWARRFKSEENVASFVQDIKYFVDAYAIDNNATINFEGSNVSPPENTEIVRCNNERENLYPM